MVKPENSNPAFPHCVANEWICLELSSRLGMSIPERRILRLPQGEAALALERFDREVTTSRVRRLHQIDLCQMLDLPPSEKYEQDGGPGVPELFEALGKTRIPAQARLRCLRWFLFNYLIGNDDAHAKNIAFLQGPGKPVLAPFYDLLCVQAYLPEGYPSMAIGGMFQSGHVEASDWDACAEETGVDGRLLRDQIQDLSARLLPTLEDVLHSPDLRPEEIAWFQETALPRFRLRISFAEGALSR